MFCDASHSFSDIEFESYTPAQRAFIYSKYVVQTFNRKNIVHLHMRDGLPTIGTFNHLLTVFVRLVFCQLNSQLNLALSCYL